MEKILVTGVAGFIGFHVSRRLLAEGYQVVGLDAVNDYYDVNLKYDRLKVLGIDRSRIAPKQLIEGNKNFRFVQMHLEDKEAVSDLFSHEHFDYVISLAAQAGVRYSLQNPFAYVDANITGFLSVLEACRHFPVKHLIYASSSSVYGLNQKMPFSVNDNIDHPISLYAVSKKANELMAHTYSHLFKVPTTGLRFFTVYGPWGRPDMALFIFTKSILENRPVEVYNNGEMSRDFTYIDDIVESIFRLVPLAPQPNPSFSFSDPDPASSSAPYRVFNIGNNSPTKLMDFIAAIEQETGKKADLQFRPIQPGDVPATYADVTSLSETTRFKPGTPVQKGIHEFVKWYREYYKV